jgi:hypothetical protein
MAELKRIVSAELDRQLGAKGTVTNVQIEHGGNGSWRIVEVDSDADAQALDAAAGIVIPKLQEEWGLQPD